MGDKLMTKTFLDGYIRLKQQRGKWLNNCMSPLDPVPTFNWFFENQPIASKMGANLYNLQIGPPNKKMDGLFDG